MSLWLGTAVVWIVVLMLGTRSAHAQSFEYVGEKGPRHWGELSPEWKACSTGKTQSPVNLSPPLSARRAENLAVAYKETRGHIFNNGHTIEVETEGENILTTGGTRFKLVQFHFHAPSEHRVGGRSYEMEVHLVHRSDDRKLAVIGVF